MSSEINNQAVKIDQIIIPQGKGVSTNVDPSLPPINGALAQDVTTAGKLYIGDGALWGAVASDNNVEDASSYQNPLFSMNSGGSNPNFVTCRLVLQKIKISGLSMVFLELVLNATSLNATCPDTWTTAAPVLPVGYRPPPGIVYQFPAVVYQGSFRTGSCVLVVLDTGALQLNCTQTQATTNLVTYTYNAFYAVE